MPTPGNAIYPCGRSEVDDLLNHKDDFHKIEIGYVKNGVSGLGLDRDNGTQLFCGQYMDKALKELGATESMAIAVFYTKLDDAICPTEVGLAGVSVCQRIQEIKALKMDFDLGSIRPGPVWF